MSPTCRSELSIVADVTAQSYNTKKCTNLKRSSATACDRANRSRFCQQSRSTRVALHNRQAIEAVSSARVYGLARRHSEKMQPQFSSATSQKLPVFVFPHNITFYLDDQSTHKQVLTLYNPYDFPVKFKVLCTASNKYKVVDPEGTIKARCCVDIVVRHTALTLANCNVIDKFRIQMQDHPSKQVLGKRDIEAQLLSSATDCAGRGTPDPDMFQQLPSESKKQQPSYALISQNKTIDRGTNYVALIAGVVCIAGLLLPTEGERNQRIPDYLHLSVNFKLIFSFVLGMVTIIVLRL